MLYLHGCFNVPCRLHVILLKELFYHWCTEHFNVIPSFILQRHSYLLLTVSILVKELCKLGFTIIKSYQIRNILFVIKLQQRSTGVWWKTYGTSSKRWCSKSSTYLYQNPSFKAYRKLCFTKTYKCIHSNNCYQVYMWICPHLTSQLNCFQVLDWRPPKSKSLLDAVSSIKVQLFQRLSLFSFGFTIFKDFNMCDNEIIQMSGLWMTLFYGHFISVSDGNLSNGVLNNFAL